MGEATTGSPGAIASIWRMGIAARSARSRRRRRHQLRAYVVPSRWRFQLDTVADGEPVGEPLERCYPRPVADDRRC